MATKSMTSELSDIDREILLMEWQSRLNQQENALLTARLQIKKSERDVQKYHVTIKSLEEEIKKSKSQINDLKGGE